MGQNLGKERLLRTGRMRVRVTLGSICLVLGAAKTNTGKDHQGQDSMSFGRNNTRVEMLRLASQAINRGVDRFESGRMTVAKPHLLLSDPKLVHLMNLLASPIQSLSRTQQSSDRTDKQVLILFFKGCCASAAMLHRVRGFFYCWPDPGAPPRPAPPPIILRALLR